MARRSPDFDLASAIAEPGFTPGQRDISALLSLLASAPAETREHAERALRRAGSAAMNEAMTRAASAEAGPRARLTALVGRMEGAETSEGRAFLLEALRDADAAVRRRAAAGLGRARTETPAVEAALLEALDSEADKAARADLVEALGKVGGDAARQALAALADGPDVKMAAELRKARLRAARPGARAEPSAIESRRAPAAPLRVWLDCRRGMLPVLLEEAAALGPRIEHRIDGSAVAGLDLDKPLEALFAARTWTAVALPSRPFKVSPREDRTALVARAVASSARAALSLTQGPLRYRLGWADGGKRRAEVYEIAAAAAALEPALVNDPADSVWQVTVREVKGNIAVEWSPALDDPRFAYRTGDVPAASHPSIAAALAFLAGAVDADVVWDPFVGSGLELCERALRGPYARLLGSDVEAAALEVARVNLKACGAKKFELRVHDAERGAPAGLRPTLIITNPPMGRRLHRSGDLRAFLGRFVRSVGSALAPGGRFVWVSPFPAETRAVAEGAGLFPRRSHVIDMGGFDAEIQVWVK